MQKVKTIFLIFVILFAKTFLYGQTPSSDSLAYEIAKGKFQIDTSLTGFKLANIFENNFIYTPNGAIDLHSDYKTSGFGIMTMPDIPFSKGIEFIQYMESTYRKDGSTINNIQRLDTLINGNKMYESAFELIDKSNKVKFIYLAFLKKENFAISFMGTDIDNGKYIIPYKKTFRGTKF